MEDFGVVLDGAINENLKNLPGVISAPESRVKLIVVATNEELAIARRSFEVITHGNAIKKIKPDIQSIS